MSTVAVLDRKELHQALTRMQVCDHVKPVAITEGMHLHLLMPVVVQ